jgi:hypothetical protein
MTTARRTSCDGSLIRMRRQVDFAAIVALSVEPHPQLVEQRELEIDQRRLLRRCAGRAV